MSTPFDYINAINNKTQIESFENYNRYVIDLGLSYFMDTILFVNELNSFGKISNEQHFDFLYHAIPKKKRFSKWNKKSIEDDLILLQDVYKINITQAKQYRKLLTQEQMEYIRNMKGGIQNG